MSSDKFRRFLATQLRNFQAIVEEEHEREISSLRSQLAQAQAEAARLKKGSICSSICSDEEPLSPISVPLPESPKVSPPHASTLSWLPAVSSLPTSGWSAPKSPKSSKACSDNSESNEVVTQDDLEDFTEGNGCAGDDDGNGCDSQNAVVHASTEKTSTMVDFRQRRQPRRSGTAPAMFELLQPLNTSPKSLKVPRRSCSMNSMNSLTPRASSTLAVIPGLVDDSHDIETSHCLRSRSPRPSQCSRVSARFFEHRNSTLTSNRNSTISSASSNESVAPFEVLKAWSSSWRKTRRMVICKSDPDAEDDRADKHPTLLEGLSGTQELNSYEDGIQLSQDTCADLSQLQQVRWTWLKRFMIQPSSAIHMAWCGIGLILIFYDVIAIPLLLFDPPDVSAMAFISWFIRVFWVADIALSFLTTGLDSQGRVEVCPVKVAKRYARTWLAVDLICVAADWGTLALSGKVRRGGLLRGLQLLRCIKLLRLFKAQLLNDAFSERMRSEQFLLIATIARSMFMMLVVAHFIACLWYGIGRHARELSCGSSGWVLVHRLEEDELYIRYGWAFHWSLALFAGEHIFQPQNMCERGFAIWAFFLFFVLSCLFVSSITTSLTRLQIISSEQSSQVSALRRYLSVHGISMSLSVRVQRNAQHALTEKRRRTREDKIDLLKLVSEPLKAEMHFEVHAPVLMGHAFFDFYYTINPSGVQRLCHGAATEIGISRGDIVFHNLESPEEPRMFFLNQGHLNYCTELPGEVKQNIPVGLGKWVSEANLWTNWVHRGTLKALVESTVLTLDAVKFQGIVSPFPTNHANIYAVQFVKLLNDLDSTMLTDLFLPSQQDLASCAFPEMYQDDDDMGYQASWKSNGPTRLKDVFGLRTSSGDRGSQSMRLQARFRKNKTRGLDSI